MIVIKTCQKQDPQADKKNKNIKKNIKNNIKIKISTINLLKTKPTLRINLWLFTVILCHDLTVTDMESQTKCYILYQV